MADRELVDVSLIVGAFLRSRADVTELTAAGGPAGIHVGYLRAERSWPLVLVTVIDETSASRIPVDHVNDATVQVEAFGASAEDVAGARELCATAHGALRELVAYDHAAGAVSAVVPEGGLSPLPDNEHDRARYQATVRVIAYPHVS